MKLFIDTADLDEIREACSWGIVDGLTTNPSLIRRAVEARSEHQINMADYIEKICDAVPGPVSLEVIGLSAEAMVREALSLYVRFNRVKGNVVIKIPANPNDGTPSGQPSFDGLRAIAKLAERDVPVNATLVMTPEQALLCAKAGARYVSPFMGRVDDFAGEEEAEGPADGPERPGNRLVSATVAILRAHKLDCRVIAASVRDVGHVRAAALAGAEIATVPFAVLQSMIEHPKTAEGIRRFTEDIVPAYGELFTA